MNEALLNHIVEAVLYEGYILYPYRPSSKKNSHRFTFGRVYPEDYSRAQEGAEPYQMETQCLLRATLSSAEVTIRVGFLQPIARQVAQFSPPQKELPLCESRMPQPVATLEVDGKLYQTWQESIERQVTLTLNLADGACKRLDFAFPPSSTQEPLRDQSQKIVGMILRRQSSIEGKVSAEVHALQPQLWKICVRISNHSATLDSELQDADAVAMRTFSSTHTILQATGGGFISLTDPPEDCKSAAASCKNSGTWPVLVGDEKKKEDDTILSSPIILPDYPQIAAESAGNLYDGTEIDEILTLRIMTMTDEEKREMRSVDEHARRLLERTENLDGDHLLKMHGVMREASPFDDDIFGPAATPVTSVQVQGRRLAVGDWVKIRPKVRADAMDLILAGKVAAIEALEEDAEGKVHLAVVLKDDPGRDLGMLRQPGHRFFYGVDEVEPVLENG